MKRKRKDTRNIDRYLGLNGRLIKKKPTQKKRTTIKKGEKKRPGVTRWESSRYRKRIENKKREAETRHYQNMKRWHKALKPPKQPRS